MHGTQGTGAGPNGRKSVNYVLVRTVRIIALYLIVGLLWIFFSDGLMSILPSKDSILLFSKIKGFAYVLITAALFFFLIFREIKKATLAKDRAEKLNHDLRDANALFAAIFDSSADVTVFAVDRQRRYLIFNGNYRQIVRERWGEDIEAGDDFLAVVPDAEMRIVILKLYEDALAGHSAAHVTEYGASPQPAAYWQSVYSPIRLEDGSVTGVACFSVNITARKLAEEEREYLLYHDKLTGLYNRRYYEDALTEMDQPANYPISLVIGDVNGLKLVNDAFGHQAGDELLRATAAAFAGLIRPQDILARWGGDEFIALLPRTGEREAQEFIEAAREHTAQLTVSSVHLDISFGWATKTAAAESWGGIIKDAEDTMYRQKMFEGQSMRSVAIQTILRTLHEKSPREEAHSERVGKLSRKIALAMGYPEEQAKTIYLAGYVHDIGKIAIEDTVLNKPCRLSDEEYAIIRKHPEIGYRILRASYEYAELSEAILSHHERWDGLGYPRGIKGEGIPIYARIIAVADSFDAMTSVRPYRKLITAEEAAEEIHRCIGRQYDPFVAWIFLEKVLPAEQALTGPENE